MIFVDEARILVKSGNGGKGCESFYRDKYMRHPHPDGGDGGDGGDIVFTADKSIHTLLDYKFKQHYSAKNGGNASSNNKRGKDGPACILRVPIGTIIRNFDTGLLIRDLTEDQMSVVIVKGAKGGRGNSKNRIPSPPGKGEECNIFLELKLVADVGLVGFPNAGKSTLISNISRVKSKIANYPFTTRQPILGYVKVDDFDFIIADLPGIIEGAHKGKGLGDRFLRHAERTKILVHVLDIAGSEGRDPIEDFEKLNNELFNYNDSFVFKHKIVVANKMDMPGAEENLKRFRLKYSEKIFPISAIKKTGLNAFIQEVRERLCKEDSQGQ